MTLSKCVEVIWLQDSDKYKIKIINKSLQQKNLLDKSWEGWEVVKHNRYQETGEITTYSNWIIDIVWYSYDDIEWYS